MQFEKKKLSELALQFGVYTDKEMANDLSEDTPVKITENVESKYRKTFSSDLKKAKKTLEEIKEDIIKVEVSQPKKKNILNEEKQLLSKLENFLFNTPKNTSTKQSVIKQDDNKKIIEKNLVDKSAKFISEFSVNDGIYKQPEASDIDNSIEDIRNKLKRLETWTSKIASHGPGGGDANPFDRVEWMERGIRFTPTPRMAYWNNVEDCLNITQADGSTLQVGLENYIRVFNDNGNVFTNGTVVEWTGIDNEGDAPTIRKFINDANTEPLYLLGVLTTDVTPNTHGRATNLGLVRDIDTRGVDVGESWSAGDLLWANPTYPGKFTTVKPTAPNVALSIGWVNTIGQTDGIITVKPTIAPRLNYADYRSEQTQVATGVEVDNQIAVTNVLFQSGFTLSDNTITCLSSGLYKFDCRVQLTSSDAASKSIIVWWKKNDVNVEFSASRQTVVGNGAFSVLTNNQVISLDNNDNVKLHMSVTNTNLTIDSPDVFNGSANIPSVQINVAEIAL